MENLTADQFWIIATALAIGAFVLGRATAGEGSSESRAEQRMRQRQEAEQLYSSLSPNVQQDVDMRIQNGKMIEAIKIVRQNGGVGLKEAKQIVDARRAAMGAL
ncbi:MAG: hypothetical protein AAGD92_01440 [Pseudomonadota bacterium]